MTQTRLTIIIEPRDPKDRGTCLDIANEIFSELKGNEKLSLLDINLESEINVLGWSIARPTV